jgi:N-acylglucosamine-6-phosphate 2-epimerase
VEEAREAAGRGAAYVATTLSGYAPSDRKVKADMPDLELVGALSRTLTVPLIAEGRFTTPEQAALALTLGAHAVVVGTAITRPVDIVKRFVASLPVKS